VAVGRDAIRTLVRQTARWAVASTQDANPLIANLHANYARATLDALRSIASDTEIRSASGLDVLDFERRVTTVQDTAVRKLAATCPAGVPRGPLAVTAGEGLAFHRVSR
jgi:tRNA G26 N,N-dimethylase Trm1